MTAPRGKARNRFMKGADGPRYRKREAEQRAVIERSAVQTMKRRDGATWLAPGQPLRNVDAIRLMCAAVVDQMVADGTLAAIAMETRKGGDVKQAPSRSDDSAGRQASPATGPSNPTEGSRDE